MFPVDAADIASADGGSLGLDQHLAVTGLGNFKFLHSTELLPGSVAPLILIFPLFNPFLF